MTVDPFASSAPGPGFADDGSPVDDLGHQPVLDRERVLDGLVWDVVRDTVDLGEAGTVRRDYVDHMGAVGICAMDEDERVLLVRQYRHAVGAWVWEFPAGLLDVDDEPPLSTAQRELAEEGDLTARNWDVLLDWWLSPGGSSEAFRLYLARDLGAVPEADRHRREAEEAGMLRTWVRLETARDLVLRGRLHGPNVVVGVLSACAAREAGWATLRAATSAWPTHPRLRSR